MNIYVGNLPHATTDSELKDAFGQYGSVDSAKIITDRETGRSRGFGFVEMSDDGDGAKAVHELNGQDFDGRPLTVNEARPRERRSEPRY